MAAARELVIADEPAAWAALGFAPDEAGRVELGGIRVRLAGRAAGSGVVELRVAGLAGERPDGLPIVAAPRERPAAGGDSAAAEGERPAADDDHAAADDDHAAAAGDHAEEQPAVAASPHPNGATVIDHVVVFTDDRDRTADALAAAGGDVRRRGGPPELPAPMAFVRFGELVVEVAQAGGAARFWGLTIVVPELDPIAGPLVGAARPAVQPGRRIATVGVAAGLSVALALITPRRKDSNPAGGVRAVRQTAQRRLP